MSHYEKALKAKAELNTVSPSFCLAKWLQVSLHLTTGRTHSCYHPRSHKIPLKEIERGPSALHNTEYKKKQRKKMLEGTRPVECLYCWTVEDMPGDLLSDRHYRSAEDWAMADMDIIRSMPWDADVKPRYLEVNFNQACQFKCTYCSPQFSSSWMAEIKQYGFYPTTFGYNRLEWFKKNDLIPYGPDEKNPYVESFWKWWPEIYPHLRIFRMTGGEPLIDPNTALVLDYVIHHPHPKLTISLTSNLCPPDKNFQQFLTAVSELLQKNAIENFFLYASIDSVGKQAEYIRSGLDYQKFNENLERYLEIPGTEISFILTFNCLSAPGFRPYLEWLLNLRNKYSKGKQRISFDTPFLHHPSFLSLQVLTPEWKKSMQETVAWAEEIYRDRPEALDGFTSMEIDKFKRVLQWTCAPVVDFDIQMNRANFFFFFTEHDRRRGTNFLKTFPEMKEFWNQCEQESRSFKQATV